MSDKAMSLKEAQEIGSFLWKHLGLGRAWHMFPNDPTQEHFKLEWPDGVVRGKGKSFEEAFASAGVGEAQLKQIRIG